MKRLLFWINHAIVVTFMTITGWAIYLLMHIAAWLENREEKTSYLK